MNTMDMNSCRIFWCFLPKTYRKENRIYKNDDTNSDIEATFKTGLMINFVSV